MFFRGNLEDRLAAVTRHDAIPRRLFSGGDRTADVRHDSRSLDGREGFSLHIVAMLADPVTLRI
jgi:hypothetical protein